MKKLQEVKDLYDFNKVWTNEWKIIVKEDGKKLTKPIVFYE